MANLFFRDGGLALHAASVVKDNFCFIFLGPSESGKTTIANLSKKFKILDDEITFVKFKEGYFNASDFTLENSYIIKAIFCLHKDSQVYIELLKPSQAFAEIFTTPNPLFNIEMEKKILKRYNKLVNAVPVYRLHFRKESSFWKVIEEEFERNSKKAKRFSISNN